MKYATQLQTLLRKHVGRDKLEAFIKAVICRDLMDATTPLYDPRLAAFDEERWDKLLCPINAHLINLILPASSENFKAEMESFKRVFDTIDSRTETLAEALEIVVQAYRFAHHLVLRPLVKESIAKDRSLADEVPKLNLKKLFDNIDIFFELWRLRLPNDKQMTKEDWFSEEGLSKSDMTFRGVLLALDEAIDRKALRERPPPSEREKPIILPVYLLEIEQDDTFEDNKAKELIKNLPRTYEKYEELKNQRRHQR